MWPTSRSRPLCACTRKRAASSSTRRSGAELAGVDQQQAEAFVAKAYTICPYSKANRGNIEVKLLANGKPVEGDAR